MPSSNYDIDSGVESTEAGYENPLCIDIEKNTEQNLAKKKLIPLADHQLIAANAVENPLNAIIKFHMDGEGHSHLARELFKQTGLLVIAIFGVLFYYVPSKAYAESICADLNYKAIPCDFLLINHVAGTMSVAAGVLMSATNAFFDRQIAESIPIKLEAYLQNPLTPRQKLAENAVTYLGSFVASIPFVIITAANPIPGLPKAIVLSQAFMVGVTNTLLHLLPFKLALKNPLYRFPFLPFEFILKEITHLQLTKEEKQERALQKAFDQNIQLIKQRFISSLNKAQRLLSIYGFTFSGCHYNNEVVGTIQQNQAVDQLPLQLLTHLLEVIHARSPNRPIPPSGGLSQFFRKMVYIPGATWVILACAGFWGGTFNEIRQLTGDPVSGAVVSAPSIYCLGVLLAFFGGNALQNSFDYLTAWKDDTVKIPMSFKLYPKTAVLLIIISMYLSAFSYSAGTQLINDNFKGELEFLRLVLLELAKTGLIFLGFTAMVDFFNDTLKKFAQYGKAENNRTVAKLYAAFNQMQDSIQLMKPNLLLESLANISDGQLKSILDIKDNNDLQDLKRLLIQLAEQLKLKIFKEIKSINSENIDELSNKMINHLNNDSFYQASTIDPLVNHFNDNPELQRLFQEYKSVCKIIERLDKLSSVFVNEQRMITSPEDHNRAGPSTSSESTPLIQPVSGSIQTHFYRPFYGTRATRTTSSSEPGFSNSNQMRV